MKKYVIVVSEPWDYYDGLNENKIFGRIVKKINDTSIIFEAENSIELKGYNSTFLFLSPRQKSDVFDSDELENPVSVNCRILHENYDESMTFQNIVERSTFVIIGRIQRV